jgi:uncharacterized protein
VKDMEAPVTVVSTRLVKPGCEDAFEEWLKGIGAAANQFPGLLGRNVVRPRDASHPEYVIIFQFDSDAHLKGWIDSDARREWLAKVEPLTQSPLKEEVLTGLETWFTVPGRPLTAPPPKHKMVAVTFLAIFPLANLLPPALAPVLSPLPALVRSLVVTLVMLGLMTYLIMPQLTRLFVGWLYPKR